MASLAHKLAWKTSALIAGLVAMGLVAIGGLLSLSGHYAEAEDRYDQLRTIYEIGHHVAMARARFDDPAASELHVHAGLEAVDQLLSPATSAGRRFSVEQRRMLEEIHDTLAAVDPMTGAARMPTALGTVARFAEQLKLQIIDGRHAATRKLYMTAGMIAGLLAVTAMAAAFIGVSQYRGVMGPLRRLQLAVGRAAGADFEHVSESGDQEFIDLARRFNRMADELAELYRSLEHKVETKSRELIRSEHLASVGYLAAGVSHEINNPISIIGGYAEAALKALEAGGQGDDRTLKALRVITEEAFRCKEITGKLLSLAAPGEPEHQQIEMFDLVRSVVELLRDHKPFAGRELKIVEEGPAPYCVKASATEIRQVLLNLVTNALESVEPPDGCVTVHLLRGPDDVLVTVEDNGRGMSPETLSKVFEPFFTDKPARDRRGMGLGLSVSHAIIEAHGGRLTVHSDGVGRGSRFVMELPLDDEGSIDVASR